MKLGIIIGSAREPRRSGPIADFVYENAKKNDKFDEVELVDVRDRDFKLDVPSGFDGKPDYDNELTKSWSEKIKPFDAFVFVMSENNHSYSASLKLAIDYLYSEWAHKPVAFVSHGGVGGARAIEAILSVARSVQLVPIYNDVRLLSWGGDLDEKGNVTDPAKVSISLDKQLDVLRAYAEGLRVVRDKLEAK